jgi:hypothetical protein
MPFCVKCGTANNQSAKFCIKCGNSLISSKQNTGENANIQPPPITHTPIETSDESNSNSAEEKNISYGEFEEQEKKYNSRNKRKIIASLLLIIMIASGIVWFFSTRKNERENKITVTTDSTTIDEMSNLSFEQLDQTKWYADKEKMEESFEGYIEFEQKSASFAVMSNQFYLGFKIEVLADTIFFYYDNNKSDWGAGFARGNLSFPPFTEPVALFAKAIVRGDVLHMFTKTKVSLMQSIKVFPVLHYLFQQYSIIFKLPHLYKTKA